MDKLEDDLIYTKSKDYKKTGIKETKEKIFALISYLQGESESIKLMQTSGNLHLLFIILETFQVISFMFTSETSINNWEKYNAFWELLSYTRLDYLAFKYNFALVIICLTSCWHVFIIGACIYIFRNSYNRQKISLPFCSIAMRLPFHIFSDYLFLPLFTASVAYSKYSGTTEILSEYGVKSIMPGSYMKFWFAFNIVFCILISITKKLLMYEPCHAFSEKIRDSKFTGKYDCIRLIWIQLQVFMHFYLLPLSPYIYYLVSIISSLIVGLAFYSRLPYYNQRFNCANVICSALVCFSSLAFVIGIYQNNATVIFVLILLFSPALTIMVYYFTNKHLEQCQRTTLEFVSSDWEFEIFIRKKMIAKDLDSVNIFHSTFKNDSLACSKILNIIESYYLYFSKDLPVYARGHLALSKSIESNFEIDYQMFRCNKYLSKDFNNDAFKYFVMIQQIKIIKKKDREVCEKLYKVCRLIAAKVKESQKIISLVKLINPRLNQLRKGYQILAKSYPNNFEIILELGTILVTFFNEMKIGSTLIAKANSNIKNIPPNSYNLNPFKEYAGNIIINCNKSRFLIATNANNLANQYLEYAQKKIVGVKAGCIIPGLFDSITFDNFNFSDLSEIKIPGSYFLYNSEGFLVPVYIKLGQDSINLTQKILITFVINNEYIGEAAIVEQDGFIIGHTSRFSTLLGLDSNITGEYISKLLPCHSEIVEYLYQPLFYDGDITLFSNCIEINKKPIVIILALKGDKQLHYWENVYSEQLGDDYMACCPLTFDEEIDLNIPENNSPQIDKPKEVRIALNRKVSFSGEFFSNSQELSENSLMIEDNYNEDKVKNNRFYVTYNKHLLTVNKFYSRVKLISVITVVLMLGVASVFLVMFRIEVNKFVETCDMKLEVGRTSFNILRAGQLARFVEVSPDLLIDTNLSNSLQEIFTELTELQASLIQFANTNLDFAHRYKSSTIPTRYSIDTFESLKTENLIQLVILYLQSIKNILSTNDTQSYDIFFLYHNSFGEAFSHISSHYFFTKAHDLSNTYTIIYLTLSSSISVAFICIMLLFLKYLVRIIIDVGKPVLKMKENTLKAISNEIKIRLDQVHGQKVTNKIIFNSTKRKGVKIVYRYLLGYIYIMILIGMAILTVVYIDKYITNFIKRFNNDLDSIPSLYFIESAKVVENFQFSLELAYDGPKSGENYITDYAKGYWETFEILQNNHKDLLAVMESSSLNETKECIERIKISMLELNYGLFSGVTDFMCTNGDLSYFNAKDNINKIQYSYLLQNNITDYVKNLLYSAQNSIKDKIEQTVVRLMIFIISVVVVMIIVIFLFLIYVMMIRTKLKSLVEFMQYLDLLNPNRKLRDTHASLNG
ncbi:hypothetical protein SteCoe_34738 [Stentor coeruleus]|uniref:Uncharacterized protein n=1 Tax=Stentor coeruleus TaxID=5963 RepID=A0A1R2ATW4_9CILI|nr:hypothetical protein SteCoe_34738 [Stentor coeruleus]